MYEIFDHVANNSLLIEPSLISFGPVTSVGFDFTPLFEDTILSLLPSTLLLLCIPHRLVALYGQRAKVASGGFLHESKLIFLAMFALLQLVLLIVHILNSSLRTTATIAASVLSFVASLGLCVLSHFEHSRSIRPSPIINGYILITLIFDVARVRSMFLDLNSKFVAGIFSGMIGVKVMVLLAEAVEKRNILLEPYRGLSPEETSGIYSKSFFFWLNQLMTSGFQRVIKSQDLYPIDSDMSSHNKKRALFWAVMRANKKQLVYCIIPRLFQIGFKYTQPFLLTRTIAFANDASQPDNIGWGLTGAFFVVLLGVAISNGITYHMTYRLVTSARGNLISIIYAKTVDLSITALDESAAVTLMSSDVQSICNGFALMNELWGVPIELAVCLYLLTRQLGLAILAPAILSLVSIVAIFSMAKLMGRA
ncbi:ABC transporter integral membrane type 1 [Penicillium taxi]|uniref:ABC transporter integral membrane type 1 n=1 Tax=Penicillium taxi TaxID=168475 RepID=UPI0025455468|nr:ABC transporter integral membrane type 1 [Penicillium taxi]KAJ5898746.1 ABC transporter integral membrane type 1 [Penicillium taxi]